MEGHSLDKALIKRIRKHDKTAIRELYVAFFKPCSVVVLKDGGGMDDAREVFQDTVFSLLVKLKNPTFTIHSSLLGYLKQTCFNKWIVIKKRRRKDDYADDQILNQIADDTSGFSDKVLKEERLELLSQCMKQVSKECLTLLDLTFYKKYRDEQIAELMNYSRQYVRNKRLRCIKSLRKCMGVAN